MALAKMSGVQIPVVSNVFIRIPNKIYDFDPKVTLLCDAGLQFKIVENNGFNALALKVL